MRIKRLEICGFKSFVDRTVLTFDDPITGVVGPERMRQVEHRRRHSLGHGRAVRQAPARPRHGGRHLQRLRVARPGGHGRGLHHLRYASRWRSDVAPGGVPWGAAGPSDVVVTRGSTAAARASTCSAASRAGCATSSSSFSARASARRPTPSSSRDASASSSRRGPRIAARSSTRRPASPSTRPRRRSPSAGWRRRASTCCA